MKTRIIAALSVGLASVLLTQCGCTRYTVYTAKADSYAPQSPVPSQPQGAWSPTHVTPYTVGRYVDARDGSILHEAHTVYRQEVSARPNRLPPDSLLFPAGQSPSHSSSLNLIRDGLTAELNEQRATSRALLEQAASLEKVLRQLDSQTQEFRDLARKGLQIQGQLQTVSNRLEFLENQLQEFPLKTQPASPEIRP